MATGTLTGSTVAARYKSLLKLTGTANDVLGADASAKYIEDGDGTDSALSISTTRVGIGTTSPNSTLHLKSSTDGVMRIEAGSGAYEAKLDLYSDAGENNIDQWHIVAHENNELQFRNYTDNRMLLTYDGNATFAGSVTTGTNLNIGSNIDMPNGGQISCGNSASGELIIYGGGTDRGGYINLRGGGNSGDVRMYTGTSGSGTLALTIDSDGDVGIGTDSPETELEIASTSSAPEIWIHREASDLTDGNTVGTLSFAADTTRVAKIASIVEGASENAGDLAFYTATGGSLAEHMRILSDGNVGIGVADPDNKLHIVTSGTSAALDVQLFLENEADGGDASMRFGSTYGTDLDYTVGTYNADDTFRISSGASHSAGTPRLVIKSGNVGIGTDDPETILEVAGAHVSGFGMLKLDSTDHAFISLDAASSSHDAGIFFTEAGTTQMRFEWDGSANQLVFYDSVGGAARMVVAQDGNVGLGTDSPGEILHIHERDAAAKIRIQKFEVDGEHVADQAIGAVEFWSNDDNYTPSGGSAGDSGLRASVQAIIEGTSADTGLQFFTGGENADAVERMRIDSSGNVGIGVTDPDENLEVSNDGANATIAIERRSDGNRLELVAQIAQARISTTDATDLYLQTDSTPVMVLKSGGNVGIGTTSPDSLLELSKDDDAHLYISSYHDTESKSPALTFRKSEGTEASHGSPIDIGSILGVVEFQGYDGDSFYPAAKIMGYADENFVQNDSGGSHMRFYTTDNTTQVIDERMRIDHNGNVGIADSAPLYKLVVSDTGSSYISINANSGGAGTNNAGLLLEEAGSTLWTISNRGAASDKITCVPAGSGNGCEILQDGTIWTAISDERVKENIVDYDKGLEAVLKMKPRKFNYRKSHGGLEDHGFIAQELVDILPEVVNGQDDEFKVIPATEEEPEQTVGYMTVCETKMTAVLVKAIQELSAKVEALENE